MDNRWRFFVHLSCSVNWPTFSTNSSSTIQHDCHRSSRVSNDYCFVDLCYSDRFTEVLDGKYMVFYPDSINLSYILCHHDNYLENIPNCSKAPTTDNGANYSCQPSSRLQSKHIQVQKISCDSTLYLRFVVNFLSSFHGIVDDENIYRIYENSSDCRWLCCNCCFHQLLFESSCVLLENQRDTTRSEKFYKEIIQRIACLLIYKADRYESQTIRAIFGRKSCQSWVNWKASWAGTIPDFNIFCVLTEKDCRKSDWDWELQEWQSKSSVV